jgi:cobalt-zinc-cadmium efflux system membrane fusion protein
MAIHDHAPDRRGGLFLWGGILAGLAFLVLALTHGFGLFSANGKGSSEPQLMVRRGNQIVVPEGSALRSRLTVAPAGVQPFTPQLQLPAVVESDPSRTAAVLPALGGRVVELKVALGDRVTRGQLLAVIDSGDLAQAWADDDRAAAELKLNDRNLARQEEQNRIGAASDRDLDQARSDRAAALAEYTRTQARLRALGVQPSAERPAARLLQVTAPVSGSVTALAVTPGTVINDPTQPLLTIADLSTVWVTAMVAEKDLAAVSRNQDAEIRLDAYPGRVLHGKVLFVADVVDADSRRDRLRIALPNADIALKPNMFATVTLSGAKAERVVLPSSALLMNNDRTTVFVATAPWTFERRTVEPQLEEGAEVAIRSGLAGGEQVVVGGGILLND